MWKKIIIIIVVYILYEPWYVNSWKCNITITIVIKQFHGNLWASSGLWAAGQAKLGRVGPMHILQPKFHTNVFTKNS